MANGSTVGLHMRVLIEVPSAPGEAPQNVDAVVHVLQQALKESFLTLQYRLYLPPSGCAIRTCLGYNRRQKVNDPANTPRD